MESMLLVAAGGALGGALRFGIAEAVTRLTRRRFPWGILIVNISGAFLLGALYGVMPSVDSFRFLALGVLGSYTTVSSFALHTFQMVQGQRHGQALAYTAASLVGCVSAAALGVMMATP